MPHGLTLLIRRPAPPVNSADEDGMQVGVHRDCFGCGRTCVECKAWYIRKCRQCSQEYCIVDNRGTTANEVRGHRYFTCDPSLLAAVRLVQLERAENKGALLMVVDTADRLYNEEETSVFSTKLLHRHGAVQYRFSALPTLPS